MLLNESLNIFHFLENSKQNMIMYSRQAILNGINGILRFKMMTYFIARWMWHTLVSAEVHRSDEFFQDRGSFLTPFVGHNWIAVTVTQKKRSWCVTRKLLSIRIVAQIECFTAPKYWSHFGLHLETWYEVATSKKGLPHQPECGKSVGLKRGTRLPLARSLQLIYG